MCALRSQDLFRKMTLVYFTCPSLYALPLVEIINLLEETLIGP